jgi:hypothetical protein
LSKKSILSPVEKIDFFTRDFRHGEWLFPAVLAANLDLEPMNLADQFVLTFLAGDILSWYAGGLPPATGD